MTIRTMRQTGDGYLWVGGYKGLGRFDGVRLKWFTIADTPTLASDAVQELYEDRAGSLWIGTDDGGIIRYRDGEFVSFGPPEGLTEPDVRAIAEDEEGRLWVGTREGLFYLVNDRFVSWKASNFPKETGVYGLAGSADGLWVACDRGLFRLRGKTERGAEHVVSDGPVPSVAVDGHGVTWAAWNARRNLRIAPQAGGEVESRPIRYEWFHRGRGGSFLLAGKEGTLFRQGRDGSAEVVARFEKRRLSSVCEDLEGNIWIGVESHGLYRARRKQVMTLSTADGLVTDALTTIAEDQNGRVWLGTWGRGLFVREHGATNFVAVRKPALINVTAFGDSRDGSLWLGTYHGPTFRLMGTQLVAQLKLSRGARAIYEDREGALWVGTLREGVERHVDGKVERFTVQEGLSSDLIRCLAQDGNGDMWIGTARGLHRISKGRVKPFQGEEALARQAILGFHVDAAGVLWAGTAGAGLARFHKGRLQVFGARHGLASEWIEQILEDDEGNLWLGTQTGILRASRADLEACAEGRKSFVNCLALGLEDGMLAPNCGSGFKPSCMKTRSGQLWFCTPGGLVVVDPKKVQPRSQPPPVHIEEVVADDFPLEITTRKQIPGEAGSAVSAVKVPARVTRVGFHYTGLSFSAPEKLRFQYRLEGYDENWVASGAAREAVYTRLPPGQYVFRVRATNKDGVANTRGAELAVTVVPPWWQTRWFQGVGIMGLCGLVFGVYELRLYQHKRARALQESFARRLIDSQEQERKRVAHELHDSLGQSLQIIKGRTQLGSRQISSAAECLQQFQEIGETTSRAIQEVRAISRALRPAEIDQLGLTKAIEWMIENVSTTSTTRFACDLDNVDRLFRPDMEISLYRIVQEGLNNVLKHAAATEVIVELKREGDTVRFSLLDNGLGFTRSERPKGLGLESIAERAKLLGGAFDIQSAPRKGTRLTIVLPVPEGPA